MDDPGRHLPVLLQEMLELLAPAGRRTFVDCTVGLGGHAEALLAAAGEDATLIGIDLDESNLLKTKERLARFGARVRLFQGDFADLAEVLGEVEVDRIDAVLADLGVSSSQLDDPGRGFSFAADGPLDMRMSRQGPTAEDLVNSLSEHQLAELIWRYGQDRHSRRIAKAIVRARRRGRIRRTAELAGIVAAAAPGKGRRRIHPATRTFQAIRMQVNHEQESLRRLLAEVPGRLAPGGRAAVISFHSLEDRLVKQAFAAAARGGEYALLTPKPQTPGAEELTRNPRSRSAKLRVVERIR